MIQKVISTKNDPGAKKKECITCGNRRGWARGAQLDLSLEIWKFWIFVSTWWDLAGTDMSSVWLRSLWRHISGQWMSYPGEFLTASLFLRSKAAVRERKRHLVLVCRCRCFPTMWHPAVQKTQYTNTADQAIYHLQCDATCNSIPGRVATKLM